MKFYTIGVYGLTADEFFRKLTTNNIDTFLDIRRRRAVRGSEFAFANSNKLQKNLAAIGTRYLHIIGLAPTKEIMNVQKEADQKSGTARRERKELGDAFIREYKKQILSNYNFPGLINELNRIGSKKVVLFCVEKEPGACHRSLVAEKLEKELSCKTTHL